MSFKIRKLVCRAIFVGLCVAPLCGSLAYAAWQHWSTATMQRGDWLAARLGIDAQIEGLRPSKPGLSVADQIRFLDPESGRLLLLCERIRLRAGPQALVVSIEDVHVPQQQTMDLWQLLYERVLKQASLLRRRIVINADRVAIRHATGEFELAGWRMECRTADGERRAEIEFRSNHADLNVRSTRVSMVRDARQEVPVTRVELHAPDSELDGCLLAGPSSWLSKLGEHVRFRGAVFVQITSQGWQGEVTGHMAGIQLQPLVEGRLPHGLTGEASVDIRQAVFDASRLQALAAVARAGPGKISAGLLQSLRRLGCTRPASSISETYAADALLDYEQFAFLIDMTPQGVILRGMCDPRQDGAVITSRFGTLLQDRGRNQRQSNFDIIAALLDKDQADVLFTTMGALLWQALPLTAAP